MNKCAFPDCTEPIVTAQTKTIIGEICHIRAQNAGGPRYLEAQDDEERHGFDNLILMCRNHHKEIDTSANLDKYTVEWLLDAKRTHEAKARESDTIATPPDIVKALEAQQISGSAADAQHVQRLLFLSRRFTNDIGETMILPDDNRRGSLYVRRDIEDELVFALQEPSRAARLIVQGAAGQGKTTLLWSIATRLEADTAVCPVLLSASWLAGATPILNVSDMLSALRALDDPVLLLDTADLLLHDEASRLALLELLKDLDTDGIGWAMTTRPEEAAAIPRNAGMFKTLGTYHPESELPIAVSRLVARHCADDAPVDAFDRILAAVARGLPVAEICVRPLLLRMMFDLAAPKFPVFAELDVTGLFLRFWQDRVASDRRTGLLIDRRAGTDLTLRAAAAGLALLSEGAPTSEILSDVTDFVLERWPGCATQVLAGVDADDILINRGVLQEQAGQRGFLHQTLFEFAAARGLIRRGGSADVRLFFDRLNSDPSDLFVGAVFEQYLLLLGSQRAMSQVVRDAVETLLRSEHPTLRGVGSAVWAHHPGLVSEAAAAAFINLVGPDELRRFADIAPTVAHANLSEVLGHVALMWIHDDPPTENAAETAEAKKRLRDNRTRRKIAVELMERFSRRDPSRVADLVDKLNVVSAFLGTDTAYLRSQRVVTALIANLADAAPALVHHSALQIIDATLAAGHGREIVRRILDALATPQVWAAVSPTGLLSEVETRFRSEATKGSGKDNDARAVRSSLAEIYAADWRRTVGSGDVDFSDTWSHLVESVCAELEADDQDPIAGAKAIAIARLLADPGCTTERITVALDRLFAIRTRGAPRELAREAFPSLLSGSGAATPMLILRLAACLESLPVAKNNPAPGTETWAAAARDCLGHGDVIPRTVAEVLTASAVSVSQEAWIDPDGLLRLLPKARVGLHPDATSVLADVAAAPTLLSPNAQRVFLDTASPLALQHPDALAPAVVAFAIAQQRFATLETLCDVSGAQGALRDARDGIRVMLAELSSATEQKQAGAARLWQALITHGIFEPDVALPTAAFDRTSYPKAKAALINTITAAASDDGDRDGRAVALYNRFLQLDPLSGLMEPTPDGAARIPQICENARLGWLRVLATNPGSTISDWPTVRGLAFRAPFIAQKGSNDIAGIGDVSRFITGLIERHEIGPAVDAFIEAAKMVAGSGYDPKQQANASNRWKRAIDHIVAKGSSDDVRRLLEALPECPDVAAQLVITAVTRTAFGQFREDLNALLGRDLRGKAASHLRRHLQTKAREFGSRSWPEIIAIV